MNDQEYIGLQKEVLALTSDTIDVCEALQKMTVLHLECNRRSMEFSAGRCSRRSVGSRKLIKVRNHIEDCIGRHISLNKRGVYAFSRW